MIGKILPKLCLFVTLGVVPLFANVEQLETNPQVQHCGFIRRQTSTAAAYGKLSASASIPTLIIASPQASIPSLTGWQPFPVDTFSTFSNTSSPDPTNATIIVEKSGTYLLNALLTVAYPDPGTDGPADLTNYAIGVIINGVLQADSIGSFHISTEAGQENPGLLFSASLSDLVTLTEDSTVQFVVSGGLGSAGPSFLNVVSANATVTRIGL